MSEEQLSLDEIRERTDTTEDAFKLVRIGPRELKLPAEWDVRNLDPGEGVTNRITDGAHHSPNQSASGDYYYATVSNMSSEGIDYQTCSLISAQEYEKMVAGDCKPKKGEVLFSKDGTVGLTSVFDGQEDVVLLSSIAMIDPDTDYLNSKYLSQYLSSWYTDFQIQSLKSGTAIRRVVLVDLEKLSVPLPPLPEQRKIATILYTVDRAIEKTGEIIEQTRRVKQGISQDLFCSGVEQNETKETYLSAIEVEIPEHWEAKPIGEIAEKITDGAHLTPDRSEDGYLLLSARNVRNGFLDLTDVDYVPEDEYERLTSRCNPEPGDILMSCSGMGLGRPCVVPDGLDFALVRSAALIKLDDSVHPEFIEQAIQHSWAQRQIQAYLSRSAQPNIFQGQIASIELPIPPLDEQRRIANILKDFDNDIDKQTEYADRLERLKQGLMQDLLSGTVRTTDTNIEVPEEITQYG